MHRLDGRIALISGAAPGFGESVAEATRADWEKMSSASRSGAFIGIKAVVPALPFDDSDFVTGSSLVIGGLTAQ